MAETYFYVEGFFQSKSGKPTSWKRVKISEVDEKVRRPASNYNCFCTVQRFKNAVEEIGESHIADLYFDLDGEIGDAMQDAVKLVDYFGGMGIGQEGIRVWFSGKKGFHVLINSRTIGAVPHPRLTYIYKHAALFAASTLGIKTFDHKVYSIKRQLRLANSIHRDTGKFKTELTLQQLREFTKTATGADALREYATEPRDPIWEPDDVADLAAVDVASLWFKGFVDDFEHQTTLEKLRPRTPIKKMESQPVCVEGILKRDTIIVQGNGNKTALALASYFKDQGRTQQETFDILDPWARDLKNTSTAGRPHEASASLNGVVHAVFNEPSKYRFACAFIRATGNAENAIPCQNEMCPHIEPGSQEPNSPIELHLSEASRAEFIKKKLKVNTVISGKDTAPFIVPRKFEVECIPIKGECCRGCPSSEYGQAKFECEFKPTDDALIQMCRSSNIQKLSIMKQKARVPKTCKQHRLRVLDSINIEEVQLIPQIDFTELQTHEYVARRGYYIGHGVKTNQRYTFQGYTIPDPLTQYAVQVFEDLKPSEDNIQSFNAEPSTLEQLKAFQPKNGQSIEAKMIEIHEDLEVNVTRVWKRKLMAISLDLIYHTALSFDLHGQNVKKGWGELLILGDSGQAKSTMIVKLRNHYQAGEIINGESATRTGLLYTLTESAGSRRWMLVWGRIPLNDMSLLIIDEASGLAHEDIAQLSGPRSSGIAEVNRVGVSAQTLCRTRLVFSSNPRTGKPLRGYQWPVLAVRGFRELIDKAEDVRRFDFAIAVKSGDVAADIMNQLNDRKVEHVYTSYLCNLMIRWVWSRKSKDIIIGMEATKEIMKWANEFSKLYHASIPLVEPADERHKIARLSIAVAGRLFSTDETMSKIVVTPAHVEYAVGIMMECFRTLGYDKFSAQMFEDTELSDDRKEEVLTR